LVEGSKRVLREKHGEETLHELVREIQLSEDLVRSRTYVSLAIDKAEQVTIRDFTGNRPTIGWLQPHLLEAGGIRRAIEMTNRLARWGCKTVLITPEGTPTKWLPILADVISVDEARSMTFDVLVLSDPDMVWPYLELKADRGVVYHLDSYMQYRESDESLQKYYELREGVAHIANSKWTAEQVEAYAGVSVDGVFPGGVDKRLFHPMPVERSFDVVCNGSARPRKSTETIERAAAGLELLKMEEQRQPQHRLAQLINSGRVFVSASVLEGFNLSALEAMACGVPTVMTDDGGSREYAVDGENALIVEPGNSDALREQIVRARDDEELRARLIENGLRKAWEYDWDTVTADLVDFLYPEYPE
jgi:hypothetical protein